MLNTPIYIYNIHCKTVWFTASPLTRGIGGRVDLFQPYEQSEIGPIEDWGRNSGYAITPCLSFQKTKNKAELIFK